MRSRRRPGSRQGWAWILSSGAFAGRLRMGGQDRAGTRRFGSERGKRWNVVVPFDQRWDWAGARDRATIKRPHRFGNRSAMGVDQQRRVIVVAIFGEAGEVYFIDMAKGESVDIRHGLEPMI